MIVIMHVIYKIILGINFLVIFYSDLKHEKAGVKYSF